MKRNRLEMEKQERERGEEDTCDELAMGLGSN